MTEALLKEIYNEVVGIRRRLELLEDALIPKERSTEEEIVEIENLRDESLKGKHVDWEDLKRDLSLRS